MGGGNVQKINKKTTFGDEETTEETIEETILERVKGTEQEIQELLEVEERLQSNKKRRFGEDENLNLTEEFGVPKPKKQKKSKKERPEEIEQIAEIEDLENSLAKKKKKKKDKKKEEIFSPTQG